jgi:hypothetical protein
MKKCVDCKELKGLSEFYNNSSSKDGKAVNCKICNKSRSESYKIRNKSKVDNYQKEWRLKNPQYNVEYTEINSEKVLGYRYGYSSKRKKYDPEYKLTINIRNLIYMSFKNTLKGTYKKGKKTESILDCTLKEFTQHLQSLFTEGMTLENHGEWEIDHIVPISSAKNEEEIYKLNHYTNFQPLWKEDNRKKSNKMLGY